HESEALAGDDLQAAIAWRGVRAEALAKRGEHFAAIELAQAAVAIASATDALLHHADARMALAAALRAAGRGAEADAEARRAIELWEAKGAVLLAERARSDRGRVAPVAVAAAEPEAAPPAARRRVRPNAASALLGPINAAIAARDFDAFAAKFREDFEEIYHPTGSTFGKEASIASLQHLFRSREAHYDEQPLATLGESLLLFRRRAGAAGTSGRRYDVGAYENEVIPFLEVDESGLGRRSEVFAANHLGDAIVRLYERHAELLPEGAERERAAAIAQAIAAWNGPIDLDRVAAIYTPTTRQRDHRVLATWSGQNAEEILRHWRLQLDLAPNFAGRYDDVLALGLDAVVFQMTFFGTGRDSGGAFENRICVLLEFGADGRMTNTDVFEAEREADALARFDELAVTPARAPVRRPVRANAATRSLERFAAALAARDAEALEQIFDESLHVVHHPSRATYGRRGMLTTWRSAMRAAYLDCRQEMLASLGDTLALERHLVSVEGLTEAHLAEFGRTELHEVALIETDDRGRWLRSEIFAADRLGEAIARLYELHAERMTEGTERVHAAAVARSIAAMESQPDAARRAAAFAPDIAMVDHRTIGTWSARGAEEVFRHFESIGLVADEPALRDHEVLALDASALLVLRTHTGIAKESGGAYERRFLVVLATGPDGSLARIEWFDADRETEALARFDALAGGGEEEEPQRFENAASRTNRRRVHCFNTRDWAGVEACAAADLVFD
ncbi:MAG: nuclear transport factor 2 family protein, partial [Proteobacteria bacterium]|nr:nuclear transport factor 2 family protein [Pseudomonadota bacterium]